MRRSSYLKIIRASAIYDLVITFPFAFPFLASWNITFLTHIHERYSFSGVIPTFLPMHLFFVNLMGCLVIVWSTLRIHKPAPLLGLYDSFGRFLFSFTMLYYLMMYKATGILWIMFIPEITWGLIQFFGYFYHNERIHEREALY